MIRTWKCLLGAWAVCAIFCHAGYSEDVEINELGVARVPPPPNAPRPADVLYSDSEAVWYNDFQPPPGVGVDPVTVPQDNSVGYAVTSDVAQVLYRINRVNRHYHGLDDDGFTSAGAFVPIQVFDNGNALFAIDPRAFVSDNGQGGVNLGATFRRYSPQLHRVFVFSNWLDYDRAGRSGAGFAQWGLHAAAIGQFWSVRSNIHLPVGQSNEVFNRTVTPSFFQNTISLATNGVVEDAYGQYDIEFSTPIPYFARFGFEFGLGYYYLDGARHGVEDGHGVSTRVETQVTENMWANAYITSDGVFGSNLSLNFEVTLPNGAPSRILRRLPLKQYLVQSDRRKYRVVRNYSRFSANSAATSTADCFLGQQVSVVHIDPRVGGGGDGSFENPFGSMAAFESQADAIQSQVELIYVHGNNDPDSDANLNTGITLFDCQRLLGAGVDHAVSTQQGNFILGAMDANNPFISNSGTPGNPVVTLADGNEVSGFRINASGGTDDPNDPSASIAIDGRDLSPFDAGPIGVRDFNINRNMIENAVNGILVNTETGGGVQTGIITENEMIGFSDDAIQINASGSAQLALTIEDNDITGGGSIVGLGFLIDGNTFGTPFDITNTSAGGLDITGFMLDLTDVNAIWDSIEPGSSIPFQPQNMTDVLTGLVTVNGNLITPGTDPLQDDMGAVLAGGGVPDDQPLLDLAFNDFDTGETFSWLLDSDFVGQPASTILGSDLIGADITVNFENGLFLTGQLTGIAGNPDASEFIATGGSLASGDGDGIEVNLSGNSSILAGSSISRNDIRGIARDSIRINGPGTSTAILTMNDNAIVGTGRHGFSFTTRDNEVVSITGTGNNVVGSAGDGLHMETYDASTLSVVFANSQFDSNAGRGVKGASFDGSTLNFSLSSPDDDDPRSSASNNGGPGIQFDATDTAVQNIVIDDVFVDPNQDAGILIGATGDSLINAIITDNEIINTEDGPDVDLFGDGVFLRASGTAELNGLVARNIITGNAGHGFRARAVEDADLDFMLTDSDISNNGGAGVHIQRFGNSLLRGDVWDNIIDTNGGAAGIDQGGIFVTTDGGNTGPAADTNLFIERNDVTNTIGGDGMSFETSGGSVLNVQARGNLVNANEINGVRVTTNGGSFFGTPVVGAIGLPSVFDSMTVTNNGDDVNLGAGYLLQTNDYSNLVVDITSIEAAIDPDTYELSLISGNFDGIRAEHRGFENVGDRAVTSIRVGDAFSNPDPDVYSVVIENNTDDAIDIDILNPGGWDQVDTFRPGGIFNMNVSDTLIRGSRNAGALDDPGVEILMDGNPENGNWITQNTIATLVFGSDISDAAGPFGLPRGPVRDAVGGPFDNTPYARSGVVITDVSGDGVAPESGDGINLVYTDSAGELNLRLFDSIVGASEFGFNTGDGIDILAHDSDGDGSDGLDVILDNTQVVGNLGDGVRIRTEANFDTEGPGEHNFLSGRVQNVPEANLTDSAVPPDGQGDTIFDGPFPGNGDTSSDDYLNSLPWVLDPPGLVGSPQNGWADLESNNDFVVDLQIINGSRIDNNGGDGVRLDIGTATKIRASLQNSSFSGNGGFELNVTTFASFETSTAGEVDNTQPGMDDFVRLDPTAKLDIYFGSLNFVRDTAAGFPEPFWGLPAEFAAAIGGEGFNTSSTNRVNMGYLSTLPNGFQTASTFKGGPRPASLFVRALVPEDPAATDVGVPLPNRFLDFGAPFDETRFFTDNLPFLGGKYLQLNTP